MRGRISRQAMRGILSATDGETVSHELKRHSPKKIINALFSFLYSQDDTTKWRAVTLMGIFVADLAGEDLEAARDVMRRLMWNLNDESGGIGWGSAEAMGEILARHEGLRGEYGSILLSYADKDGNYLELPMLQRGLLWGIARLSEVSPQMVKDSKSRYLRYLVSEDPAVRGHAARILGLVGTAEDIRYLEPLIKDESPYATYSARQCSERLVGSTAKEAVSKLNKNTPTDLN